jgi:hypothetical protein
MMRSNLTADRIKAVLVDSLFTKTEAEQMGDSDCENGSRLIANVGASASGTDREFRSHLVSLRR